MNFLGNCSVKASEQVFSTSGTILGSFGGILTSIGPLSPYPESPESPYPYAPESPACCAPESPVGYGAGSSVC